MDLLYRKPGDAMRHLERIRKSVGDMHRDIRDRVVPFDPPDQLMDFVGSLDMIPAYFNGENVRELWSQRGDIVTKTLWSVGMQPDYGFPDRPAGRKPRFGIIAHSFGPSAETYASLPYYEHLEGFDVRLFSLRAIGCPVESYCASRGYLSVVPMNEMAKYIRDADLDLLLVATNVTAVTNPVMILAAHRLARVQFTSAFSVVTTGLPTMDYFLSGTFTDPSPNAQDHYREKLIRMEGSCHCFSYPDAPESQDWFLPDRKAMEHWGVPVDAVLYASAANYYKITPELLLTWAEILKRVDGSRLMLMPWGPNWSAEYPKAEFSKWVGDTFQEAGVDRSRILLFNCDAPPLNRIGVREMLSRADVYLDSFPFSGTTSLVEPLQAGLPVVTIKGEQMRGAMGAAMMAELDLWAASTESEYVDRAVLFGSDRKILADEKKTIRICMDAKPRFLDSRLFAERIAPRLVEMMNNG